MLVVANSWPTWPTWGCTTDRRSISSWPVITCLMSLVGDSYSSTKFHNTQDVLLKETSMEGLFQILASPNRVGSARQVENSPPPGGGGGRNVCNGGHRMLRHSQKHCKLLSQNLGRQGCIRTETSDIRVKVIPGTEGDFELNIPSSNWQTKRCSLTRTESRG